MSLKNTLTASAIMALSMFFLAYVSHGCPHLNKPFETFPKQIGEWVGKERFLDAVWADDYFLCDYDDSKSQGINLYIGFYQREEDLIYSPKYCKSGSGTGWNITQTDLEEMEIPGVSSGKMKAVKLIVEKGPYKQIMLYWFQSRGRIISSEYMQKVYRIIDLMTRHRTDGAFVRLIAPITNDNETETLNYMKDFARQLMPKLNEYIPS